MKEEENGLPLCVRGIEVFIKLCYTYVRILLWLLSITSHFFASVISEVQGAFAESSGVKQHSSIRSACFHNSWTSIPPSSLSAQTETPLICRRNN